MKRSPGLNAIVLTALLLLLCGPATGAQEQTHTLQKGETLYQVARRYRVPLGLLVQVNKVQDPSRVPAGTVLKVPRVHVVGRGETLYGIARRYGVSLDTLIAVNGIRDTGRLPVGRDLFIPAGSASRVAAGGVPAGSAAKPPAVPAAASAAPSTGPAAAPAAASAAPAAGSASTPAAPPTEGFWPHPGPREILGGKLAGIVIRGAVGDGVRSVSAGQVVWVGPYRGFGKVVFVETADGYVYVYAGNERILVEVGEQVSRGMEIGRLGRDAHGSTPRLIFMVYHRGRPIDPRQAPRA